ncbi:Phosphorylated carbohydrates phosphatase [Halomicronema hongdechloris C2206]|uniref:Phosphorylated carbohydrates phosphatase n=1 Tax=Halomicronema hongdechloris C2206 TaxID=1641165 RepID=A0A1Z3HL53_9CYAN|nr:HAD family phosphatase [Halomicronema hongdechloris]ASC71052.1 Phosphorylated carbohydrates phosphatase [Halomicronema hongdechloris C2206]
MTSANSHSHASLKALLLDFNGIIINDESLHCQLLEQLLLEENLRPNREDVAAACLGRSDRACLTNLLGSRGRVVSDDYLDTLLAKKSQRYIEAMSQQDLPLYPGLDDLVFQGRAAQLKLAVVTGTMQTEVAWVLRQAGIYDHLSALVCGDDLPATGSKPAPDGYLLAIERLNQAHPGLNLTPAHCLAIEDSFAGIEAAKRAQVPVAGVAHTYPYQMIHRRADWVVDNLSELDLDWLRDYYANPRPTPSSVSSVW